MEGPWGHIKRGRKQLVGRDRTGVAPHPLRLVFILLAKVARLVRAVKGQKQLPKMR